MSLPELERDLSRVVREAQAENRLPSLSAAVFRAGEVVWRDAVGSADLDSGTAATPETQYRVGSITKTFTAASIIALRDEGKLALDDPLGRHVPDAAHGELTIRRMLAHVSGLQREFADEMWESLEDPPREELLAGLAGAERVLEPGAHWHYSNLAFATLGEVVERCSGQPWERFVAARFLESLGLTRTTLEPESPAASGYLVEPYQERARREGDMVLRRTAAAGQLWSTTGDLARWGAFLADPDEAVLSPASVEQMHAVQVMAEPDRWLLAWGLGLMLHRRGDRIFAGHGGAMPGFLAELVYSRPERIGAVVLTNSSVWPAIDEFAFRLVETALDALPLEPEAWRPEEPAPPELAGLLGRWWTEGSEFVLRYRGGRLEARMVDLPAWRPPSVFEPDGDDRFRVVSGRERGESLRVVRDENGEPIKLYWATYPCTRRPEAWG